MLHLNNQDSKSNSKFSFYIVQLQSEIRFEEVNTMLNSRNLKTKELHLRLIDNMKKALSIIISLIYLMLSTGAAVNLHYCGGKLANININNHSEGCCCGNKEMSKSCCNDKEFNLSLDVDQQVAQLIQIPTNDVVFSILTSLTLSQYQEYTTNEKIFIEHNIPPPKSDPIWLLNCSLKYYG